MNRRSFRYAFPWLIVLAMALCSASSALAVSTIAVSSTGSGVFLLQGLGMDNVSAMDITLQYDAATLANPRVEQGSLITGAMMAANPNTPGVLRIAIIRTAPIAGSGPLLTLTFDRAGSAPGTITGLQVKVSDIHGKPLLSSTQIVNPAEPAAAGAGLSSRKEPAPHLPAAGPQPPHAAIPAAPRTTGEVRPDEDRVPAQEAPAVLQDQPELPHEPVVAKTGGDTLIRTDPNIPTSKSATIYTRKSVLERFRNYKGARSSGALLKLFDQDPMIGFQQYPAVALSDGKSTVAVRFISTPDWKNAKDLGLMGARLVALTKDPDATNTWIVTLLPEENSSAAGLSVPQGGLMMVFPLVVAPKADVDLDHSKSVTEADLTLFLSEQGTAKAPRHDLNRDGVRDYRDDYMFIANYLAARGK